MFVSSLILVLCGIVAGLAFAPIYFIPGLFSFSYLLKRLISAKNQKEAFYVGYAFGIGFFLATLYWIAMALTVFIEQFWWLIPFAVIGFPIIMAFFTAFTSLFTWHFRNSQYAHILFCITWIFVEWVSSWIFTGLPWSLLGYSLTFSDELIQAASIFSVFGLSFVCVYVASVFYIRKNLYIRIFFSLLFICSFYTYGAFRIANHVDQFLDIKARIVQPSIQQTDKWNYEIFWKNLNKHIELSMQEGDVDLIIWSEASIILPYYLEGINSKLREMLSAKNAILIAGGITDNSNYHIDQDQTELYTSMIALDKTGDLLFEYNKSHLVPFGEYIPMRHILPFNKITHGAVDYTPGKYQSVYLEKYNLRIKPQICYESIFPLESIISMKNADVIINITNDSWYGKSSGTYQHLEIAKMRAIENGISMIRVANNGISAIITPLGAVVTSLDIDYIGIIDSYIPLKLKTSTYFAVYKLLPLLIFVVLTLITQSGIELLKNYHNKELKN